MRDSSCAFMKSQSAFRHHQLTPMTIDTCDSTTTTTGQQHHQHQHHHHHHHLPPLSLPSTQSSSLASTRSSSLSLETTLQLDLDRQQQQQQQLAPQTTNKHQLSDSINKQQTFTNNNIDRHMIVDDCANSSRKSSLSSYISASIASFKSLLSPVTSNSAYSTTNSSLAESSGGISGQQLSFNHKRFAYYTIENMCLLLLLLFLLSLVLCQLFNNCLFPSSQLAGQASNLVAATATSAPLTNLLLEDSPLPYQAADSLPIKTGNYHLDHHNQQQQQQQQQNYYQSHLHHRQPKQQQQHHQGQQAHHLSNILAASFLNTAHNHHNNYQHVYPVDDTTTTADKQHQPTKQLDSGATSAESKQTPSDTTIVYRHNQIVQRSLPQQQHHQQTVNKSSAVMQFLNQFNSNQLSHHHQLPLYYTNTNLDQQSQLMVTDNNNNSNVADNNNQEDADNAATATAAADLTAPNNNNNNNNWLTMSSASLSAGAQLAPVNGGNNLEQSNLEQQQQFQSEPMNGADQLSAQLGPKFDVPQIECPVLEHGPMQGLDRFSCPSKDKAGRYKCIMDHEICDGYFDCPGQEDEDRKLCMFYKATKSHVDILADTLLRWARKGQDE